MKLNDLTYKKYGIEYIEDVQMKRSSIKEV